LTKYQRAEVSVDLNAGQAGFAVVLGAVAVGVVEDGAVM